MDRITLPISFDNDMNVHIQSNSLSDEVVKELENMINERENYNEHETLQEIDHIIKSNSFGFEVTLSTSDGNIAEIVEKHIEHEKQELLKEEMQEVEDYLKTMEMLEKELNEALSL